MPRNSSLRAKIYPQDFGLEQEDKGGMGADGSRSPTRAGTVSGAGGGLKRFLPRDGGSASLPLASQTGPAHGDAITSSSISHSGDEAGDPLPMPTSPAPAYSSTAHEGGRQHAGIAATDG